MTLCERVLAPEFLKRGERPPFRASCEDAELLASAHADPNTSSLVIDTMNGSLDICDSVKQALEEVRNDGSSTNYAILGYEGKARLILKGTGVSVTEAIDCLGDDEVSYVFLRMKSTRDQESKTVKFVK